AIADVQDLVDGLGHGPKPPRCRDQAGISNDDAIELLESSHQGSLQHAGCLHFGRAGRAHRRSYRTLARADLSGYELSGISYNSGLCSVADNYENPHR